MQIIVILFQLRKNDKKIKVCEYSDVIQFSQVVLNIA